MVKNIMDENDIFTEEVWTRSGALGSFDPFSGYYFYGRESDHTLPC